MNRAGPLTIAMVIATPGTGWGGMERHTADLAQALSERGHRVHLLAHPAYGGRFADSVLLHPLSFQLGRNNPWLKYRLRRTLKSIRPDLVHAQGNKAASLISSFRQNSVKTLGTLHGTKSSHRAFRKLDGVIGVSREITDSVVHRNTRLIYNGLPPQEQIGRKKLRRPDIPIPNERPLLLAAGRLEPVKQFDRLIRAWVQADCAGRLVILGEGSQRTKLESLILELGAENRVLLPGHESQILPWLQVAAACIISSRREGFPYIMVEALMADCPVLSTPVSGVRDFLPETCVAVTGSVDDIASLIRTRFTDANPARPDAPAALTASSQTGFQRAREQLSLETMVSKTEAFYRDLLASLPQEH